MKLTQGLAAVVLLASASIAQAEITGNASVVSDYNWRGITQTAGDPAIQGGIDYAHESGFYAGAWGSNVDFGDCCDENLETDLYFGWSGGETSPGTPASSTTSTRAPTASTSPRSTRRWAGSG